jgi:site-specific DNA recombinase
MTRTEDRGSGGRGLAARPVVRAALYVRVSTDAQAERWSLPAQRRALVEHAERQGWAWEVYEDAGISGETLDARPAMLRLLEDARSRRVQVALAIEMERFSRSESLFDWLVIKQAFRQGRVRFGTPAQLYDPADTEDDFLTDLFGALAKREKRKIVERTRRGRYEAARRGRHVVARAPFGYVKRAPGVLEVDPDQARAVRRMYELAAEGWATRAIARELTRLGIAPPRGSRRWHPGTVCKILRSRTYAGVWVFGRTAAARGDGAGGRRRIPQPPSQAVEVPVPPIVAPELWERAQRALSAWTARVKTRHRYLLRGLAVCGVCGRRLRVNSTRPGGGQACYRYYKCPRRAEPGEDGARCPMPLVRADDLEGLVWSQVRTALSRPEEALRAARELREGAWTGRDEIMARLEAVSAWLARVPEERERAQRMYREGYATWEEVTAHLREVEDKRAALERERAELEAKLGRGMASEDAAREIGEVLRRVGGRLDAVSWAEKARAVMAVVRKVVVHPGEGGAKLGSIEIHAVVPLPEGGGGEERRCAEVWMRRDAAT